LTAKTVERRSPSRSSDADEQRSARGPVHRSAARRHEDAAGDGQHQGDDMPHDELEGNRQVLASSVRPTCVGVRVASSRAARGPADPEPHDDRVLGPARRRRRRWLGAHATRPEHGRRVAGNRLVSRNVRKRRPTVSDEAPNCGPESKEPHWARLLCPRGMGGEEMR